MRPTGLRYAKRIALLLLIAALLFVTQSNSLPNGISFTARMRAINRLKNRTLLPRPTDFDERGFRSRGMLSGEV